MPNCSLLDSKNQNTEANLQEATLSPSGKMEVMSDNSLDEMKFRNCQEDVPQAEAEVAFDASLNGVNQQEMDTDKYNDGCEDNYTNGNSCENGVEAMDTDGNLINDENYEQGNEDLSNNLAYDEEEGMNFPSCVSMEYQDCSPQRSNGDFDDVSESGNFTEQEGTNKELDDETQNSNEPQDFTSEMSGKDSTESAKPEVDIGEDKAGETDSMEKPVGEEEDKEAECENEGMDENLSETREEGGTSTEEGDRPEDKESQDTCDGVINLSTPTKSQLDEDSTTDSIPDKLSKKKKSQPINVTPRRSSRNLNKTKNYTDELVVKSDDEGQDGGGDDDRKSKKNTIVVSDTKKLVEIASVRKVNKTGKKEPTLVIIDTNSLLAAKRAASQAVGQGGSPHMTITPSSGPMRRVSLPANSVFHKALKPTPMASAAPAPQPQPKPQPQVILPSLTDDMSVVEAPSFIAPYVYEKPPVNSLKDFLKEFEKNIKKKSPSESKEKSETKMEEHQPTEKEEKKEGDDTEKPEKTDTEDGKVKAAETGGETKEEEKSDKEDKPEPAKEGEGDAEPKEEAKTKEDVEKESEKDDDSKDSSNKEEEKEKKDKTSDSDDTDVILVSETKKSAETEGSEEKSSKKSENYFDNPLGKFFMQIGINLVQEHVQIDLLRNQQRKRDREGKNVSPDVLMAISSLSRTLHSNKDKTDSFKFDLKKCHLCNFKTESQLVMAHHLEIPHMKNYLYHCNFCDKEVRNPHDILFHMESQHNVRGKLERTPAFHQCPNCPFEDNQKGKLSRHFLSCAKKFKPERNQEPSLEWEPPAKIPRIRGARGLPGSVVYPTSLAPRLITNTLGRSPSPTGVPRRGRPPIYGVRYPTDKTLSALRQGGVMFRPTISAGQPPMLVPNPYQLSPAHLTSAQILQTKINSNATAKLLQQPSISITPLPRSSTGANPGTSGSSRPPSKATFVICEICDGYIKDLEQLRNHMQWIHKVKIHPKMIYSRPPLNCQKCQSRFFTDQGLERHLLGSHGLVTTSMQEASNRGKDGGRCPVCGRVFQWKLLNHVAVEHRMELKPAHLSYKCTVCTATFGMYKLFENHVYSAHSVVPKQKSKPQPSTSSGSGTSQESLLRPLKINDEITIIPQPARSKDKPLPPAKPPK